ncbi:MAG: transposase [Gammaproteobacteria bacterium]|nr:transposase [Gammaproteobacteria bacterium]
MLALCAFINATLVSLPGAEKKVAFDKFHVAKYLGEAVDKVRRQEHKELMSEGYEDLKGSKYGWLYNPHDMTHKQKLRFKVLRESTLKRARAWAIKEVVKTIKAHLWGIFNAVVPKVINGPTKGLNSRIKMIRFRSRGFHNKERFANVIYFHLGGLDLYPEGGAGQAGGSRTTRYELMIVKPARPGPMKK